MSDAKRPWKATARSEVAFIDGVVSLLPTSSQDNDNATITSRPMTGQTRRECHDVLLCFSVIDGGKAQRLFFSRLLEEAVGIGGRLQSG